MSTPDPIAMPELNQPDPKAGSRPGVGWTITGGVLLAVGLIALLVSIVNASTSLGEMNPYMGNESEQQIEAIVSLIFACAWAGLAAVGGILLAVGQLARNGAAR